MFCTVILRALVARLAYFAEPAFATIGGQIMRRIAAACKDGTGAWRKVTMIKPLVQKLVNSLGYQIVRSESWQKVVQAWERELAVHAQVTQDGRTLRTFVIFSLPKSGANALRDTLQKCKFCRTCVEQPPSMEFPNGIHVELPLHNNFMKEYPNGGLYHCHAPVTFASLDVLERDRIPYIISIRDPLDQIVAWYCHVRKYLRAGYFRVGPGRPGYIYASPMAWNQRSCFEEGADIDEALRHLIQDGYLTAVLRWICDWCEYRNEKHSLLIKYEDYISFPREMLQAIGSFLYPAIPTSDESLDQATATLQSYREMSENRFGINSHHSYPRGYSGEVGIKEKYLSTENKALARRVVERFLNSDLFSGHLLRHYPKLLEF